MSDDAFIVSRPKNNKVYLILQHHKIVNERGEKGFLFCH